jgi:hypothetical protein
MNEEKKILLKYARVREERHLNPTPKESTSSNGVVYSGSNGEPVHDTGALVQAASGRGN